MHRTPKPSINELISQIELLNIELDQLQTICDSKLIEYNKITSRLLMIQAELSRLNKLKTKLADRGANWNGRES